MFWYHSGMGAGMFWLATLGQLFVWGAIVAAAVLLTRAWRRPSQDERTAEEILARRFARGELTEEEFRRRLGQLRDSAPPGVH